MVKVLEALQLANLASTREGNWSSVPEVNAFRAEAGLLKNVNTADLDKLVDEGTAEGKIRDIDLYPVQHNLRDRFMLYRAVRAATGGPDEIIGDLSRTPLARGGLPVPVGVASGAVRGIIQ